MNEKYRHCVVWMEGNTFKHSKIHQDCQYWPVELDRFQKSIISTCYKLYCTTFVLCTTYAINSWEGSQEVGCVFPSSSAGQGRAMHHVWEQQWQCQNIITTHNMAVIFRLFLLLFSTISAHISLPGKTLGKPKRKHFIRKCQRVKC